MDSRIDLNGGKIAGANLRGGGSGAEIAAVDTSQALRKKVSGELNIEFKEPLEDFLVGGSRL